MSDDVSSLCSLQVFWRCETLWNCLNFTLTTALLGSWHQRRNNQTKRWVTTAHVSFATKGYSQQKVGKSILPCFRPIQKALQEAPKMKYLNHLESNCIHQFSLSSTDRRTILMLSITVKIIAITPYQNISKHQNLWKSQAHFQKQAKQLKILQGPSTAVDSVHKSGWAKLHQLRWHWRCHTGCARALPGCARQHLAGGSSVQRPLQAASQPMGKHGQTWANQALQQ